MDFRRNEHLNIDTHAAPHAPLTTYRIADNWFSGTYTTALRDALPTEMTDSIAASTTASIEAPSTITTSNSGAASLAGATCPSTMNSTAVLIWRKPLRRDMRRRYPDTEILEMAGQAKVDPSTRDEADEVAAETWHCFGVGDSAAARSSQHSGIPDRGLEAVFR
ncbi:hypothetical protein SNOG_04737 [Parastagonospora nodorum SN15]|uniref:Uncharacterized protein n=1 Tax=Phaeosphaeria nodorum (strain SN15 / ATCC MYA-4574 / FGSC 10173) TaxID=321614 RepID=Q0UU27_PHANO|nr:hypothetical protein SNOG_04737 [Parastagonospora nodorum SN15]EAT88497.1 hypothetical protein SNOG_04737 [Parastagonospora nodorum SN15]